MESLKEKTAKGMFWSGVNNFLQQLLGALFGIILGRLLDTTDYGLMSMIAIFPLVATALQNSGFSTALMNMEKPRHEDFNSVFWFNIIVAAVLYAGLLFCAPLIASYFHEPRLVALCHYAFLSIIIASFSTAQNAYLTKHLMQKEQAKAGLTAVVCSCTTGATMAFLGYGYWSLATQQLVYILTITILYWHYSEWRPTLHIDLRPAMHMFRFSVKILGTNIINIVNNNVVNIILGRYYGSHQTGLYNQAYQWNSKACYVVQSMVGTVAQPVLVAMRDRKRQLNALRKMVRFTAFLSFPLLFGFGLVSREFILITIKAKWLESVPLLQMLCVSGATLPISTVLWTMVISKGKANTYFWCTLGLAVAEVLTMIGVWRMGIHTMVFCYMLINVAWMFVWHFLNWRLISYSLLAFLKDIMPFCLAALGVMTATHFITLPIQNLILLLFVRIVVAAVLYYAVMRLARVAILDECMTFIKDRMKKK